MNIPEQAKGLVDQLVALGYHSYQIKQMLEEIPGFSEKGPLSPELEKQIIQVLEDYLRFARKCQRTNSQLL
jgi:Holliday junction resolvasome RuvABC DNA-binding subunit